MSYFYSHCEAISRRWREETLDVGSVCYIYYVLKTDRMQVFAPAEQYVYSSESYQVLHSSGVLCLTIVQTLV